MTFKNIRNTYTQLKLRIQSIQYEFKVIGLINSKKSKKKN